MESLPEELLVLICQYSARNVNDLLTLETVLYRVVNNTYLWYYLFKTLYPGWSHNIPFGYAKQPLINWRKYVISLVRQQERASNVQLESFYINQDDSIQPPFVYDIDPITNRGVAAVSVACDGYHKILFFSYPSFELLQEYKIHTFLDCRIIGIQSVVVNNQKTRLFSIALGLEVWEVVLIYRLYNDDHIECLAHVKGMAQYQLLGRGIFFFSSTDNNTLGVEEWLSLVCPQAQIDDCSLYMLAYGPKLYRHAGYGHIIQFNLHQPIKDPFSSEESDNTENDAKIIYSMRLGTQVICMLHFRHCSSLQHLICTANYESAELSIYDWRFGIKVGSIPYDGQPWGFELAWAVPPPSTEGLPLHSYGLRLIAVTDQKKNESAEISVLDISDLLQVQWDPFTADECSRENNELEEDMPYVYSWWNNRNTDKLRRVVLHSTKPYNISRSNVVSRLCVDGYITAYNILQTTLYLLTGKGNLIIMDMEYGKTIKVVNVDTNGIDINVLNNKDVVIIGENKINNTRSFE
ncbi:hypothetical protein G6F57_003269 [Rhizopus arrhizus]|uniref:F-box domain-containing protein n=1 Tax=Rhizopus oryzae TaxID=64495 RepID=A0A9P6XGC1_RHIOR|nr:hypothetical protein G6F30_003954 [Rhizopus arrhizus]KAG1425603.1 hypothetical protein G6F58_001846 [Rhizopus delemar]KAG0985102.1 hypothetical protein G6F29_004281 [Rhizopus arrhizus]KAG0996762.1 hypothetical protein G6F28_003537 [Rhizopus arrhizus]KAG1010749.1 hypothetical protein G6F27_004374 [Rhizopus arrhizus]